MQGFNQAPVPTDIQEQVTTLNNKSFSEPANNTNFNNITVAGAYCFSWIASGTTYNRPVNQGGLLIVSIGYNAEVKSQQYTDTNGKVYARGYHDGAWTSWQELALKSDSAIVSGVAWGTTFSIEQRYNIVHIFVNNDLRIQVWCIGETGLSIASYYTNTNGMGGFTKSSSTNSITFSGADPGGNAFTISRSGKILTITKSSAGSMFAIS